MAVASRRLPVVFLAFVALLLVAFLSSWNYESVLSSLPARRMRTVMETWSQIRGHADKQNDSIRDAFLRAQSLRVLIWVMTTKENHQKKAVHVKLTWGKRADRLLFISDAADKALPAVGIGGIHGRQHLTMKTMRAFQYIHDHHMDDADWFMKADDDTFVIVENLRYMLSRYDTNKPMWFGCRFHAVLKSGFYSGGAGYVLSKEALKRFGKRNTTSCAKDGDAEDVRMAKCLTALGVKLRDSNDEDGTSLFHVYLPYRHVTGNHLDWFRHYKGKHILTGIRNMSHFPVSFHYVPPQSMYDVYFFIYHTWMFART